MSLGQKLLGRAVRQKLDFPANPLILQDFWRISPGENVWFENFVFWRVVAIQQCLPRSKLVASKVIRFAQRALNLRAKLYSKRFERPKP